MMNFETLIEFNSRANRWIAEQQSPQPFPADRKIVCDLIPELMARKEKDSALYLEQLLAGNDGPIVEMGWKQLHKLTIDMQLLTMRRTLMR